MNANRHTAYPTYAASALLTGLLLAAATFPASVLAQDYDVPANTPPHIRDAVESGDRSSEQRERDAGRLPAEILTLADLNEGDHIAEITSFGQYYTTMIHAAIGPRGEINMFDMPFLEEFGAVEMGETFAAAHGNVDYEVLDYNSIEFENNLDAVYNVLFYHDFGPQEIDTESFNSKVFEALRPGGKYLVIDHKAQPGSGWEAAGEVHRIDPQIIINEVTAAGFNLIADSDLLDNPDDSRTLGVFSPEIRGETARSVLLFQKPY